MRLLLLHAQMLTLELARYPAYVVPTLAFPAAFFLIFGSSRHGVGATIEMATFAGFAAIGVAFFQFGVGIAVERSSPWETYLRTLPIGAPARLGARLLSAALFASAASGTLVAVALASTDASLSPAGWTLLAVTLLLGVAPFALLGIALGYWTPARGALPIANLLYLALSYAGALWMRPHDLPASIASVSPYLPTRALADGLTGSVLGDPFELHACVSLAGFTALFAALAVWGYRRDEARRFR